MYIIWFTANIHGGLDHFSLDFKTLFLRLEVGMRFKALHYKSNIICRVVKIHQWWILWLLHNIIEWISIHYLWLKNSTKHSEVNLAHTWIIGKTRLDFRSLRFQEGNITNVRQKRLGFCLRINRFWVRVLPFP